MLEKQEKLMVLENNWNYCCILVVIRYILLI